MRWPGSAGVAPGPRRRWLTRSMALERLWRDNGAWLGSLDVNPLIVTEAGVVAVDALFVAADQEVAGPWPTT